MRDPNDVTADTPEPAPRFERFRITHPSGTVVLDSCWLLEGGGTLRAVEIEHPLNGISAAFTGRIGKDAEVRLTRDGKPWASFSVAVDTTKDSEAATSWEKVALFGETVDSLAQKLVKGTEVYTEGRLSLRPWTDANGKERPGLSLATGLVQIMGIGRRQTGVTGVVPDQTERHQMPWKPGESGNLAGRPPGLGDVGRLRAALAARLPEVIESVISPLWRAT